MNQKRDNNMLIVCFLRKTLMFTNTAPDAKKEIKKACNLCKTYELYWSEKGNLGCKIVHQRDIMIGPTDELPFPLITIVAEPQPGDR